jgi:hypothetical protein
MHLEGVKNGSPAATPVSISIEITIAIPATPYLEIAVPAITTEAAI